MESVFARPKETSIVDGKWVFGEDFISQFRGRQPKWGFDGLGWVVYVRTYSREKADGTMESWWETAERVTLGNYNTPMVDGAIDPTITKEELERFYFLFFNLALTPPGRSLWVSGTEYAETNGDSLNNCWYVDVKPASRTADGPVLPSTPFCFAFDQSCKGGGVGAGIYKENVAEFPITANGIELVAVIRADHSAAKELDDAGIPYITPDRVDPLEIDGKEVVYFEVPDSREGWVEALATMIDGHYTGVRKLYLDVSIVRERGQKIKRFGGTASGPFDLVRGFRQINNVLNNSAVEGRRITTVEAGDLIQILGTIVVAGNIRRTAIILLGSESDKAFIESKDWSKIPMEASQWRWASNNSITIDSSTTKERLVEAAESIYYNGEPGVVSVENMRNYGRLIDGFNEGVDPKVTGTNPCGEISLESYEPCNLFEINMVRCMELGGVEVLLEAAFLAARYCYRVTFRPYEWERSRMVISGNRRLGVGITGYSDYTLLYHDGDYMDTAPILDMMYQETVNANIAHAEALGTEPSIKRTTVKPSGSVSKLMGVSAGQHDHWDEYIIQRIRIAADAPIMELIYKAGYPVEPLIVGRDNDGNPNYDYRTVVVEFPVKAPTAGHPKFKPSSQVPLKDQAKRQAVLQTYWADNQVSATLTFHKASEENGLTDDQIVTEIADMLNEYKGVFKSTSLLPHAVGTYDQMPWESITKEEYERRISKLSGRPWDFMDGGLRFAEEEVDASLECVGANCPIR